MERDLQHFADGVTLQTRQINGLNLSKAYYPPNLRQPRHTHKFASFSFVLAGSYREKYDRRAHARKSSTIIFHPPAESHAVAFETNVQILSVQFDFSRLALIREHSSVLEEASHRRTENISRLGRRIAGEFQQTDAFSALALEGLVLEILAEASRDAARTGETGEKSFPPWLADARDFLHANFADSFFVEDVARLAGVHPVHLARVFRRRFGCTIGEYVRRLRLDYAGEQIAATETPLSEIALAAGFSDQSHLNKTFKSVFGHTPAAHRKIARRGQTDTKMFVSFKK